MFSTAHRLVHVDMFEIEEHRKEESASEKIPLKTTSAAAWRSIDRFELDDTFLAIRSDHKSIPNKKPLYWKCIWSTMRKPGWRNSAAEMMRCVDWSTAPRTKLLMLNILLFKVARKMQQRTGEEQLREQAPLRLRSNAERRWQSKNRSWGCSRPLSAYR